MATEQSLTEITEQDDVLNSLLKESKTSVFGDDDARAFRKIGSKSFFRRCCGQGMIKLETYVKWKTPKGVTKEQRTYADMFYCSNCGSTHHPDYSD